MGADTFGQFSSGKNAQEAFTNAVQQAQYDHGHSGYTGTIAEKDSFIPVQVPQEIIDQLNNGGYLDYSGDDPYWEKVDDKWGPAGCIDLGNDRYFFFGWASS